MDEWKKEGLKEIGLTETDYYGLAPRDRAAIDYALKELGH